MSPEQCLGQKIDPRTDIYSFGCLMFELLTKKLPFRGETMLATLEKHIDEAPPTVNHYRKEAPVSKQLESIVNTCLEKDLSRRYASAEHLKDDLKALSQQDKVNFNSSLIIMSVSIFLMLGSAVFFFKDKVISQTKLEEALATKDTNYEKLINLTSEIGYESTANNFKRSVRLAEKALNQALRDKASRGTTLSIGNLAIDQMRLLPKSKKRFERIDETYRKLLPIINTFKKKTLTAREYGYATNIIYIASINSMTNGRYEPAIKSTKLGLKS